MTPFEEISTSIVRLEAKYEKVLDLIQNDKEIVKISIISPVAIALDEIYPSLLKLSLQLLGEEIEKLKKQLTGIMYPIVIDHE